MEPASSLAALRMDTLLVNTSNGASKKAPRYQVLANPYFTEISGCVENRIATSIQEKRIVSKKIKGCVFISWRMAFRL